MDVAAIVVLLGSLKQRALLEKTTVKALSETRQNQLRYTRNFALSLSKCFRGPASEETIDSLESCAFVAQAH